MAKSVIINLLIAFDEALHKSSLQPEHSMNFRIENEIFSALQPSPSPFPNTLPHPPVKVFRTFACSSGGKEEAYVK